MCESRSHFARLACSLHCLRPCRPINGDLDLARAFNKAWRQNRVMFGFAQLALEDQRSLTL